MEGTERWESRCQNNVVELFPKTKCPSLWEWWGPYMWRKKQNMNVVLFWPSLLVLMDNYRIKIQCDLTDNKNHKLRENIVQCLSKWAFKERTYRTTQTQNKRDCNVTLENRKQRGADSYSSYRQRVSYTEVTSHYVSSRQGEILTLLSILLH